MILKYLTFPAQSQQTQVFALFLSLKHFTLFLSFHVERICYCKSIPTLFKKDFQEMVEMQAWQLFRDKKSNLNLIIHFY